MMMMRGGASAVVAARLRADCDSGASLMLYGVNQEGDIVCNWFFWLLDTDDEECDRRERYERKGDGIGWVTVVSDILFKRFNTFYCCIKPINNQHTSSIQNTWECRKQLSDRQQQHTVASLFILRYLRQRTDLRDHHTPSPSVVCWLTINIEATKEERVGSFYARSTLPTESNHGRVKVDGVTVNEMVSLVFCTMCFN